MLRGGGHGELEDKVFFRPIPMLYSPNPRNRRDTSHNKSSCSKAEGENGAVLEPNPAGTRIVGFSEAESAFAMPGQRRSPFHMLSSSPLDPAELPKLPL